MGAGIAGLSTAYWLEKENPNLKIAILEKNNVAYGASGRNAGFVTCGSTEHFIKLKDQFGLDKAIEIWKFSERNRELLIEHIIENKADLVDYKQTGSCTVAPNSKRWAFYQETAQVMRKAGIDVSEVGPQDMKNDYGVNGFEGGIEFKGDGYVHPVKLLRRIREKIAADIFENTEVFSIDDKPLAKNISTSNGLFVADKMIITVNAYLALLIKNFEKVITPGRGQILLTKPLPLFVKGPCYLTKHLCYFRQLPTGHLLVGGFRNLALDVENTFVDETTPLIQIALLDFVKSHFKFGAQAEIEHQWSGLMGFSVDGQMLIGEVADMAGVHMIAGCSGHGMGLGFHAGKVAADHLFGKPVPSHLNSLRAFS